MEIPNIFVNSLPVTITSFESGVIASQILAFQESLRNNLPSLHPAKIPRLGLGLSEPSGLKLMGAWNILIPDFTVYRLGQ